MDVRQNDPEGPAGLRRRFVDALWRRWQDVRAALSADGDLVRLRVWLAPADAEMLYRAVPPATRFLAPSSGGGKPTTR